MKMVGLAVVLEGQNGHDNDLELVNNNTTNKTRHMVIHHTRVHQISPRNNLDPLPSPPSLGADRSAWGMLHQLERYPQSAHEQTPVFLDSCFLCRTKLLPTNDIYMYKGDMSFCSVECRCRQILLDEQIEKKRKKNIKTKNMLNLQKG